MPYIYSSLQYPIAEAVASYFDVHTSGTLAEIDAYIQEENVVDIKALLIDEYALAVEGVTLEDGVYTLTSE